MKPETPAGSRRAPRAGAVETSLAKSLLRPVGARMPEWQAAAAMMLARAQRERGDGLSTTIDLSELEALEKTIKTQRDELMAKLLAAPDSVRHHGRVDDIFRAIDRLLSVTGEARASARGRRDFVAERDGFAVAERRDRTSRLSPL
jgi:hypothetical protein